MTKVLVTGSRNWTDWELVYTELGALFSLSPGEFMVIHGGCPSGADAHADDWYVKMYECGMPVQRKVFPVTSLVWQQYGKVAGPMRNSEMVKFGADVCLAFIKDKSRGASDCASKAENAGIRTVRFKA